MNTIYKVLACTICLGLSLNIQLMAEETSSVDAKGKPWMTDSPSESVEKLNKEVQKYSERHETYEQVNMSKIEMFPEEYVGRRFVFDKCYVEPEFEEPSTLGIPKEKYFAFTIKPVSSSKKYKNFGDVIFIAKKSFAKQWADKIGDGNFTWPWSVVSGTMQKFGWKWKISNDIQWHYAFVIDEFVVCNTKTGEPIDSLFFCEEPVSDKNSPETKSFIVINSRLESGKRAGKAKDLYDQAMRSLKGDGVLQNSSKGFNLLKEAADLGNIEAIAMLAALYYDGMGCERDKFASFKCAEKAQASSALARTMLARLYFEGFKDDRNNTIQDYRKAYELFSKSSVSNYYSEFFKGLMEYHGLGTAKDLNKSAETFYSCCKEKPDDPHAGRAAICLAHMYVLGEGVGRNRNEARKWFKYGVETTYPKLVTKAKGALTEYDVAAWRDATGGKSITITPFQWKMINYIGEEGVFGSGKGKMDLLNQALVTAFQSDVGIWNDVKDEL